MRTEEFDDTSDLVSRLPDPFASDATVSTAEEPTTPQTTDDVEDRLARNQERRTSLESRRASMSVEEYRRESAAIAAERQRLYAVQSAVGALESHEMRPPEAVSGSTSDDLTTIGAISPQSISIVRSGPATADTVALTLDWADMPVDPRILRAAAFELTLGVVSADDYEAGMERGETRRDGSLLSIVGSLDNATPVGACRDVGFVDEATVKFDSEGGDSIDLQCRDASAVLRDTMLPTGESIDLSRPLDEALRAFLDSVHATTRGMTVSWEATGDPPTPSASTPTRRQPRRGQVQRRARRGGESMSLWDHITDVVRGQGFMPFARGWDLVVTDPRTLYTTEGVRRMVYGRNLSSLEFTRKVGGVKVPTYEVRCYDSERGRTLWARYPVADGQRASGVLGIDEQPGPGRANEVPPSGSNPDEGIRVMLVSGITDTDVLARVARGMFEQTGRQEITGRFETSDAWSYDTEPELADLLTLKSGDAVELLVSRAGTTEDEAVGSNTTLAQIQAMDRRRRSDYMVGLGWSRAVADRFAALQDATGFQTTFRVSEVSISFDPDSGLRISVDFMNYIVVREDGEAA